MSDRTDETARAIAECQHVDFFNFDPLFKQERFADLQKHAKFWLLRKRIIGKIDAYDRMCETRQYWHHDGQPAGDYGKDLLDKIKELDG